MAKTSALILCAAAAAGVAGAAQAADLVRSLTLEPGKGVSFYMGSKHGVTLFEQGQGACNLTVTIAEQPDQTGMAAATASRIKMAVVPDKPARVETAEGQALVFACSADAKTMKLDMPKDFKYQPKG